jgi:hypothetical protein
MKTPDGRWRVEMVQFRNGSQMFRVRRPMQVSSSHRGWWPTGQLCATVSQVQALLGDSFAQLTDDRSS